MPPRVASAVAVLGMLGVNVGNHVLGWNMLWLGPLGTAFLLAFARWCGLTWQQLGLAGSRWRSGVCWGGAAVAAVGSGYLVAVLVPATRGAFLDERYHFSPWGVLLSAFVVIPLGTVLFEEMAFRSVLWGLLDRHTTTRGVAVLTSVLFGLWHVLPALSSVDANPAVGEAAAGLGRFTGVAVVGGTVLVTSVGGLVFAWLRHRSDSVLASMGMHWATNGLGVLFGLLAWRLAG